MDSHDDYTMLNRSQDIFLFIPRHSGPTQTFMREQVLAPLKESGYFDNVNFTTSLDFVAGSDRQDSFVTCHSKSTCAIYPICREFLEEFKSSFKVSTDKVIFLICEKGTGIPPHWEGLENVDYLQDDDVTFILKKLITGVRAILGKRPLSEGTPVVAEIRKKPPVEYERLHGGQGGSRIAKHLQPSYDAENSHDLNQWLNKLNLDHGPGKAKIEARLRALQMLQHAIEEKDIAALALGLTCKDEQVLSVALHQCTKLLYTSALPLDRIDFVLPKILNHISTALRHNSLAMRNHKADLLLLAVTCALRILLFMATNDCDVTFDDLKKMKYTLATQLKDGKTGKLKKVLSSDNKMNALSTIFVSMWEKILEWNTESNLAVELREIQERLSNGLRRHDKPTRILPAIIKATTEILHGEKEAGFKMLNDSISRLKSLEKPLRAVAVVIICHSLRYVLESCVGWQENECIDLLMLAGEFMTAVHHHTKLTDDVIAVLSQSLFCSHLKKYQSALLKIIYDNNQTKLDSSKEELYSDWLRREYSFVPLKKVTSFMKCGDVSEFEACVDQQRVYAKIAMGMLKLYDRYDLDSLRCISAAINALEKLSGDANIVEMLAFQRDSNKPVYYMIPRSEHGDLFTFLQNYRNRHERLDLSTMVGFALDICSAVQACLDQDIMPLQLLLENFGVYTDNGKFVVKLKDFELSEKIAEEDVGSFSCATARQVVPLRYQPVECLQEGLFYKTSLVYYVGCVLYSLFLYGAPPFFEQSMKKKMELAYLKIQSSYHLKQTANISSEVYAIIETATLHTRSSRNDLHTIRTGLSYYQQICPRKVDLQEETLELPEMDKFKCIAYHRSKEEVGMSNDETKCVGSDTGSYCEPVESIYDEITTRDSSRRKDRVYVNPIKEFVQTIPENSKELKDLRELVRIWMTDSGDCRPVSAAHMSETSTEGKVDLRFCTLDSKPLLAAVGVMSDEELKQLMIDITTALHHDFHRHGFIHTDLKAANIRVLNQTKEIVFIKYGRVRRLPKHYSAPDIEQRCLKIKEAAIHDDSLQWYGFEVLKMKERRIQSDIYSLGIVFWQIWTARNQPTANPYRGVTREGLLEQMEKKLVLEQPQECPHWVFDLMKKCWKQDPLFRPSWNKIVTAIKSEHSADLNVFNPPQEYFEHPDTDNAKRRRCRSMIADVTDRVDKEETEHGCYDNTTFKEIRIAAVDTYMDVNSSPPPPIKSMYMNQEDAIYNDAHTKMLYFDSKSVYGAASNATSYATSRATSMTTLDESMTNHYDMDNHFEDNVYDDFPSIKGSCEDVSRNGGQETCRDEDDTDYQIPLPLENQQDLGTRPKTKRKINFFFRKSEKKLLEKGTSW